ncbi:RNA polymerase sigma factor [Halarcobacter bivalviorum]|uniref:RNA polymerase subunit sigma n=1 Tax=Halarcobacter bivalviorum TaxID=663364 RepID=A0AAX2A9Y8_9BACT|nr:sigma-70 family RNA polymerase sigma factor [Halarcobacter bivalviorum]AXH13115.1 sigma factor, ECF family [Halarcobacter bivalviorum]RXK10270.1 RNA polymerase subunit sigma [Halarcobacter bivalviorum]
MVQYYQELIYYVQRMIGDKEKAKDVIQEAYSRLLYVNKNSNIDNERAYLYKTSRNIVIDQSRKEKNSSVTLYEEEEHTIPQEEQPQEQVVQSNQYEQIMKIVQGLPPKCQQAFILHVIEGYSRKEISSKMGISIAAVEKNILRASEKIKNKLNNY